MKKLILSLMVLFIAVSSVFAMGGKEGADESLNKVLENKVLVLGLDDAFPPMGYRDENGEIVGFDIDVAREVCKRLGIELKCQPIDWSAKELELSTGNIDCIWNGFTVTEERKANILFSDPYLKNRQVVVVNKKDGINSVSKLKNKKVGVQAGSSGEFAWEKSSVYIKDNVVGYKEFLTAILDLSIGGISAVVIDEIVADAQIKKASAAKNLEILRNEPLASEDYAIGFRKTDVALRNAVQNTINEMKADGTLREISTKWFGTDLTNI